MPEDLGLCGDRLVALRGQRGPRGRFAHAIGRGQGGRLAVARERSPSHLGFAGVLFLKRPQVAALVCSDDALVPQSLPLPHRGEPFVADLAVSMVAQDLEAVLHDLRLPPAAEEEQAVAVQHCQHGLLVRALLGGQLRHFCHQD
eukprot:5337634-Lingulodinium_polyedra.AAC.1